MNNEIKEILDKLKSLVYDDYCLEFSVDYIERKEEKALLDYITNLEKENENKDNKILELQQELLNKKLNVKDIEYKEKMLYKSKIDKAIDTLQYIIDYGFDYDGLNTVESLKGLIDMLVDYAIQTKDILKGEDNNE